MKIIKDVELLKKIEDNKNSSIFEENASLYESISFCDVANTIDDNWLKIAADGSFDEKQSRFVAPYVVNSAFAIEVGIKNILLEESSFLLAH